MVITFAQLHSTKPELRSCVGSNPARGVSEIRDNEDLWQWSRLEIRINAFRRLTIPQKQFIIIHHHLHHHIIGITELKLDLIANDLENNQRYNIFQCDRNTSGGGAVCFVRKKLCFNTRALRYKKVRMLLLKYFYQSRRQLL